jgi:hypothetical protein
MFDKILSFFRTVKNKITGKIDLSQQKIVNALQRDKSIGELEKRYTPLRALGGYRLQRTGKHRLSRRGNQIVNPPGSKLWRKTSGVYL